MSWKMNHHSVTIEGDPVRLVFTCDAPDTADCRNYPDSESWSDDDGQERIPHDKCWLWDWFDNDTVEPSAEYLRDEDDYYKSGMSGPITASFNGDYVEWAFQGDPR